MPSTITERVQKLEYDFRNESNEVKKNDNALTQMPNTENTREMEQAELTRNSSDFSELFHVAPSPIVFQPVNGSANVPQDKKCAENMVNMEFPKIAGFVRDL